MGLEQLGRPIGESVGIPNDSINFDHRLDRMVENAVHKIRAILSRPIEGRGCPKAHGARAENSRSPQCQGHSDGSFFWRQTKSLSKKTADARRGFERSIGGGRGSRGQGRKIHAFRLHPGSLSRQNGQLFLLLGSRPPFLTVRDPKRIRCHCWGEWECHQPLGGVSHNPVACWLSDRCCDHKGRGRRGSTVKASSAGQ